MNKVSIKLPVEVQKNIDEAVAKNKVLNDQTIELNKKIKKQIDENARLSIETDTLVEENKKVKHAYSKAADELAVIQKECENQIIKLEELKNEVRTAEKALSDAKEESNTEREKISGYVEKQREVVAETAEIESNIKAEQESWSEKKRQVVDMLNTFIS